MIALSLRTQIVWQISALSFAYADLRVHPYRGDDELKELVWSARDLRNDAWRWAARARSYRSENEARLEWAALDALDRLQVRVGLKPPDHWRPAGFYPGDLAADLRTYLEWRKAIER